MRKESPFMKGSFKIMPVAPLMKEHRMIERVVAGLRCRGPVLGNDPAGDIRFITAVIGFMRTYADLCHHGKEENILFQRLRMKPLSEEHERILQELLQEHEAARVEVLSLDQATEAYHKGDQQVFPDIREIARRLVDLYARHIEKEDRHFFLPCMKYFDKQEWHSMLEDFYEFDRSFIHEYYEKIVKDLESTAMVVR